MPPENLPILLARAMSSSMLPILGVFLTRAASLLKKELSTLNRTAESWVKGILVAERLLGLVPRGTHAWSKFVPPAELERWSEASKLEVADVCGMRYRLAQEEFVLQPACLSFNYIATLRTARSVDEAR